MRSSLPGLTRGYVLAGGRSTRMGRDKAEVILAGSSLLGRALATMRLVCGEVAVVSGEREMPAGVRRVADRFPGSGPLGGIEAALDDLRQACGQWAVFLPVDMPLVPGGLLRAMAERWMSDKDRRVGFASISGIDQPLVCVVHVDALPEVTEALAAGDRKLRPVLERAAARVVSLKERRPPCRTEIAWNGASMRVLMDGTALAWRPVPAAWELRDDWFLNANTPEELARIQQRLAGDGDNDGRFGDSR